jgi:hypothetical protein
MASRNEMAAAGDAKTLLITIIKIARSRAMPLPVEVMGTETPQFLAEQLYHS